MKLTQKQLDLFRLYQKKLPSLFSGQELKEAQAIIEEVLKTGMISMEQCRFLSSLRTSVQLEPEKKKDEELEVALRHDFFDDREKVFIHQRVQRLIELLLLQQLQKSSHHRDLGLFLTRRK